MSDEKPIKLPNDFKGVLGDLLATPPPRPEKPKRKAKKGQGKAKRR